MPRCPEWSELPIKDIPGLTKKKLDRFIAKAIPKPKKAIPTKRKPRKRMYSTGEWIDGREIVIPLTFDPCTLEPFE